MSKRESEEALMRSVSLQNAAIILIERQKAEQELVRAKEELERKTDQLARSLAIMQATLESTSDAIIVTDAEGKVVSHNENFLRMWNLTNESLSDCNFDQLISQMLPQFDRPAERLSRLKQIYEQSPSQSETFDLLTTCDGREIEQVSRVHFTKEDEVGRVWIFRDISERVHAVKALREEARILELLNETGRKIASTLEFRELLQAIIDSATQLTGAKFGAFFYTAKTAEGENLKLFTLSGAPREDFEKFGHPRATALFGPTFQGEGPIRIDDVHRDPRYGTAAPYFGMPAGHLAVRSYLSMPVASAREGVVGGLFFGHPEPGVFSYRAERIVVAIASQAAAAIDNARLYEDVKSSAEQRESLLVAERAARQEAERISLMKDEFLTTLSHELRTPLNSILGWSELLQGGDYDALDLEQGIASIVRNAKAQTQLIEDLLDMSRVISGKLRIDRQETDVLLAINTAIAAVIPLAEAKSITIHQKLDPGYCTVIGDPHRLQQVIWNLLSNALKFTPKHGQVTVTLAHVDSHLEIKVSDSGIGIKAEFIPFVFERFRQADSSTTRPYGGLGLGLAIVKELVDLQSGTVTVESAGEGLGTSFTVRLPKAPQFADDPRDGELSDGYRKSSLVHAPSLSGIKILVLDDELDTRDLLKRLLLKSQAMVWTAASADEGLKLIQSQDFHIMISDIGMPQKDGYQFLSEVRLSKEERLRKIPAIALTAFARPEDRTRALLAGFQLHISKPIDFQELLFSVASLTQAL